MFLSLIAFSNYQLKYPFLEWYNRLRGEDELMLEFQRINKARDPFVLIVGIVIIIIVISFAVFPGE